MMEERGQTWRGMVMGSLDIQMGHKVDGLEDCPPSELREVGIHGCGPQGGGLIRGSSKTSGSCGGRKHFEGK